MNTIKRLFPFSLLFILLIFSKTDAKAQLGDTWRIISDNNLNGSVVVELKYAGRLSFRNNEGEWIEILTLNSHNSENWDWGDIDDVEVDFVNMSDCWICWWDTPEFYVAFKPPKEHYNRDLQLRFEDEDHNEVSFATVQAWKPGKLPNLKVSNRKHCNEVRISWHERPDNVSYGMHHYYYSLYLRYDVYRDSSYIGSTYYGDTTFTDTSVEPGTNYFYDVRYSITDGLPHPDPWDSDYSDDLMDGEGYQAPWEYNYGERTYPRLGASKARLQEPMEVFTNDNQCGSTVELNWYAYEDTANNNTVDHYLLQRATNEDFTQNVEVFEINETNTIVENYEHEVPENNVTYYFRLKTVNACGNESESWSKSDTASALTTPLPPADLQASFNNQGIVLSWKDQAAKESNYIIERKPAGADQTDMSETIDPNSTEYMDAQFSVCTEYQYTVKAVNGCGESDPVTTTITVQPDPETLFDPETFEVSKGYYPDRVELSWEVVSGIVEHYEISRRVAGTSASFEVIGTTSGASNSYIDESADAGVLYDYKIRAVVFCHSTEVSSDEFVKTGFRVKAGSVSGKVTYKDGSALKNAELLVTPVDETLLDTLRGLNASLKFDGSSHALIPYQPDFNLQDAFTLQMWVNPDTLAGTMPLLEKSNGAYAYGLSIQDDDAAVFIKDGADTTKAVAQDSMVQNKFVHLAGTFDGNELKIFINGRVADSASFTGTPEVLTEPLYAGSNTAQAAHYKGLMDEVLVWERALSAEEIALNYGRFLAGSEEGLTAYYRADINTGDQLFDYARTGDEFNKNHGNLYGVSWTDEAPSHFDLTQKGLTNKNGYYEISYARYINGGTNYQFTPFYGQHTFDPGQSALYVGEAAYYNTLNFSDLSSVKVTGMVKYKDSRCLARGIGLYLDGKPVVRNGKHVKTDKNGEFEIQVPSKGEHRLSVGKAGHSFDPGIWPADSATVFNEPVSGLMFIDTTKIRVVGRVVGGLREANKKPALGKSNNNLGEAEIIFRSQMGYGCSTDTVTTDPQTGEYAIDLLPLDYVIKDVTVLNNLAIDFGTQEVLRLSTYNPLQTVYDTIINQPDTLVDSARFHVRRDFIYRTDPRIKVTDPNGNVFIGEESVAFEDDDGNPVELPLTPDVTGFPVFFAGNDYTARIFVHEKYVNADNEEIDLVPLKNATVRVNNDIALVEGETDYTRTLELRNEQDGDTLYNFMAGEPNFLTNSTYPEYNYTKTFKIEAEVNEISTDWQPGNSGDGDNYFRGYVLGRKSSGNADFVSGGSTGNLPQLITVLRDPPGDQSQAYMEQNSTFTTSSSVTGSVGAGFSIEIEPDLGVDTEVDIFPAGPDFTIEADAGPTFKIDIGSEVETETESEATYEISEQVATSGAPELVGAREDLFVGTVHNYTFGKTTQFNLVEAGSCQDAGGPVPCIDSAITFNNQTYRLGLKNAYSIIDSVNSTFALTYDHIKNYLIPSLKELRNNLFVDLETYKSNVPPKHPNYGTNNDDPVWGGDTTSADPYSYVKADSDGPSYTTNGTKNDSVRWYNQKIRAWETLLEQNEREKALANPDDNITFEGGGSTYEYSYSLSESESFSLSTSFNFEFTVGFEMDIEVVGLGLSLDTDITAGGGISTGSETSSDTSVTYGYSLADDDQGDFFSVDVTQPTDIDDFEGTQMSSLSGPIFRIVGGRSMCPWEGPVNSNYYSPVGQEIAVGTMQREKPQLNVTPNVQNNIPPDEPAVYRLTIGNASETNETMWYNLKVAEDSNPYGAQLKLDGGKLNRTFEIPGGESYQKTLTLNKTPGVDNYNDIEILLFSSCEWDYHTNGGVFQAVDTVTITAQFIPSCSNIAYLDPANQWVANTSNKDTLWTVLGEYNQNFPNFKKFQIQYKHVSESQWFGLETYWNDSSGMHDTTLTMIPEDQSYTMYPWDISQVPDGEYELRAVSFCPLSKNYTRELRGIIDRIPPHPYGSPQPADGILSPDDDLYVTFNEPLHGGKLTKLNMDIRGVLNGADLVHNASMNFDGENDYVDIPSGLAVSTGQPFTFEMWIKRNRIGKETVLSQQSGQSDGSLRMGFNAANQFVVDIAGAAATTSESIVDQLWHHYACTYNPEKQQLAIYLDGEPVTVKEFDNASYQGAQKIVLGRDIAGDPTWFNGNIHEVRLWHTERTQADIVVKMNRQLTGMEFGLIGYWPLDDAFGSIAKEKVHHRHAQVHATWDVYPSGNSYDFANEEYLTISSSKMIFTDQTDFTISFWFKADNGQDVAFLSNGKGDGTDANASGWAIHTNSAEEILVKNNGHTFKAVPKNYFDNNWHHFALVVSRYGNTHAYIDGELQNTTSSEHWTTFGGPKLWVGSRGWLEDNEFRHDQFFNGKMDELRIWYVARKYEQIKRDMTYRLAGDEIGLMAYYPFEHYEEDAGVNVLAPSLKDKADTSEVPFFACRPVNDTSFSATTPNIKLNRPVEKVNYNYSFKEDEIMFCIGDQDCPGYSNISADALKRIENSTLDVTVKDVYDLQANKMRSPEVWSVYVDQVPVSWQKGKMALEKKLHEALTFEAVIKNRSGRSQEYEIRNLPEWMSVSNSFGTLSPLEEKKLYFTVHEGLNIGQYSRQIYVYNKAYDFNEKMLLTLDVQATAPDWEVAERDYQYSMSITGQLAIDSVISHDPNDVVAAFVDGQCRGVANVEYVEAYDMYELFLDIYSPVEKEENMKLRVWDASTNQVHPDVTPEVDFNANKTLGSASNPRMIYATETIRRSLSVQQGWNWLSFNLNSPDLNDPDVLFDDLEFAVGNQLKGSNVYDQFDRGREWKGSLSNSGGLRNEAMYMLQAQQADTLVYSGITLKPGNVPITLREGWNWIGYIPNQNLEVNDALSSLHPSENDLIKSQRAFAMYDEQMGWLGSLEYLAPDQGYMLYVQKDDLLRYPASGLFSMPKRQKSNGKVSEKPEIWDVQPGDYENTMNIVARIEGEESFFPHEGDFLGAFHDGECVGIAEPKQVETTNEYVFFITAYSKEPLASLSFRYFDYMQEKVLSIRDTMQFKLDAVKGTPEKPVVLHKGDVLEEELEVGASSRVFPNPFRNFIQVRSYLKHSSDITLRVMDVTGNLRYIRTYPNRSAGWNTFELTGKSDQIHNLPAGTYLIEVRTSAYTDVHRIIKSSN